MKSNFDARKAHENGDTLPDQAGVYVPPRPVASISEHRTMDIKAIRLAAELDPRQARTQLRMQAPRRRRRRLSPFWIASLGVVALLGVGTYIALVNEAPLPLVSSEQRAPEVTEQPALPEVTEQPALPTGAPIDTVAPPPPLSEVAGKQAGAAPLELLPPEHPPAEEPPVTEPTVPASARAAAEPAPRPSPPRKSKARQDPWLE
jgi:hypothetical protein